MYSVINIKTWYCFVSRFTSLISLILVIHYCHIKYKDVKHSVCERVCTFIDTFLNLLPVWCLLLEQTVVFIYNIRKEILILIIILNYEKKNNNCRRWKSININNMYIQGVPSKFVHLNISLDSSDTEKCLWYNLSDIAPKNNLG